MKLSTKGRYGVKAMVDLAIHNSEGQVSLKSIAERQQISENYLEQIFAMLRKAGIVKSIRGAQGGYNLAQCPETITVGAVLRALEGSLAPVNCVVDNEASDCARAETCVTKLVWQKIRDCVDDVVDSIYLKDLVDEYLKINESHQDMYYI